MRWHFENVIFYRYKECCPFILILSIFRQFSSKLINFNISFKSKDLGTYLCGTFKACIIIIIIENIFKDNELINRGYIKSKHFFKDCENILIENILAILMITHPLTESKHFHFQFQSERIKKITRQKIQYVDYYMCVADRTFKHYIFYLL